MINRPVFAVAPWARRRHSDRWCAVLVAILMLAGLALPAGAQDIERVPVWEGLPRVTAGAFVPGAPQQMLVTRRTGELEWLHEGSGRSRLLHTFDVRTQGSLGLLSVALHPAFPEDDRVFVYLTPEQGSRRGELQSWRWRPDQGSGPALRFEETLLQIPLSGANNAGGSLAFDHEGYLYLATGDGGIERAAQRTAQDLQSLRGKVLRLDVGQRLPGQPYRVPRDNPWVGESSVREEIWAYGLRAPGAIHTHDAAQLWVPDGQDARQQEINRVRAGDNLGWRCFQGTTRYLDDPECEGIDHRAPWHTYQLRGDQRVVGGFVYSGEQFPQLRNRYLFADFHQGVVWGRSVEMSLSDTAPVMQLGQWNMNPSALIERPDGEIMVSDYLAGRIYLLRPPTAESGSPSD